ncbi:Asparagine-rich protein (ARP protein) [Trifolium repens]|nr:Asparagine-rich protein (ARP protein) [Trifolium repens]
MRGKCFEKCITKEEGSLNFIDVVQYPIEEALQSHLYEFKNEIYTLSKIEHLNLRTFRCCCKGDFNRSSATSTRLHGPNIAKEQRDGRSYNRGDMYEISHTKRNGSYVNDEARQKNEELQKERQTSSDNEAFVTVFGKEHHGYVRGMGLGPTPSQINGSSCRPSGSTSSSTADAKIAKMQSEIDVLTKEVAEVNELKAKVAEFDAMKEQFALIMANMQNHGSNIGSPFEVRRSSESSHNVEGDQATPDD